MDKQIVIKICIWKHAFRDHVLFVLMCAIASSKSPVISMWHNFIAIIEIASKMIDEAYQLVPH